MKTNNKKEHCLEIRKAIKHKGTGHFTTNAPCMKTQIGNNGVESSMI